MSSNDAFSIKSADTANERRCTQCQVLSIVLHASACDLLQVDCPKRSQKATVNLCPIETPHRHVREDVDIPKAEFRV